MSDTVDFNIHNNGSLIGFTPVSEAAQAWVDDNVESEGWQWMGNTLWIDHRCAENLIGGIIDAGLAVTQ